MLTLVIDGDPMLWKASWGLDDSDRGIDAAVKRFMQSLMCLGARAGSNRNVVCLSDASRRYFRHLLYPEYKADPSPQPPVMRYLREAVETRLRCRCIPGLEADDVCGILMTHPSIQGDRLLYMPEKDSKSIPGRRIMSDSNDVVEVTEEEANYAHMYQTLVGDGADGYPGCPGVGPVNAKRILNGDKEGMWMRVMNAFQAKGLSEGDAVLQARLARILRASDYDDANPTAKIKAWQPPYGSFASLIDERRPA